MSQMTSAVATVIPFFKKHNWSIAQLIGKNLKALLKLKHNWLKPTDDVPY